MSDMPEEIDPSIVTFAERRAIDVETVSDMVSLFQTEGQARYVDLPSSDVATYSGILDMEFVNSDDESIRFVADMTATVTIGPVTVTGNVSNFQDQFDVYHDGSLEMEMTGLNGATEPLNVVDFNQTFSGSVVLPEGEIAVVASGDADFTGLERVFMAGEAYGLVTIDGVNAGTVEIDYAVKLDD